MYMCFPTFAIQQSCLIQKLLFPENAWVSALLWEALVSHQDSAFYCLCVSKQPKGIGMSKKPAKGLSEPIIQGRLLFISGRSHSVMGTSLDTDYGPKLILVRPYGNRERYWKYYYVALVLLGWDLMVKLKDCIQGSRWGVFWCD